MSEDDQKKVFDEKIGFRIVLLANLLSRPFYSGVGQRYKVGINEWRMMLVLKFHPNISATQIGELTGLQKMAVSRGVRQLIDQGYAGAGDDPVDGRKKIVNLTRAGRNVVDAVFPKAVERDQQIRSGLSSEEHQVLLDLINKVIATIRALDK